MAVSYLFLRGCSIVLPPLQTDVPVFDQIEKLKRDLTDKYVVVDASVPELRRFEGHTGQVKTINMNGRALVEFDAWANIGWYDIELNYLKVVPKPEAPAEAKKHDAAARPAAKPAAKTSDPKPAVAAGEKKLSPLEMARIQGAAKGAPAPAGEKPAAAAGVKKSTADILAAARAKQPAVAAAAAAPAKAAPVADPPRAVEAPPAAATPPKPAAAKPALTPGQRPSIPEILAWCRQHDAH